jgi:hypothetical protein
LSVYNSGAPTVTAENLGQQNGTSFTWTVDIAAGQSVGFNRPLSSSPVSMLRTSQLTLLRV